MKYVRNAWYVAFWSHELAADAPVGVRVLNQGIVLWRDAQGEVHALEDRCVHRLAALSKGRCEGVNLRCMYHGLLIDPQGKVVAIPGQEMIPPQASVRAFPIVESDGWIWLWMGDAAKADLALLPRVNGPADPAWQLKTGQIVYDAEARLINDNLTDFCHLAFVHASSFGATASFAETPWKITQLPRGVRFERWSLDQPPVGQPGAAERFDVWMDYEYLIPGILQLKTRIFDVGMAAERFGLEPPPPEVDGTPTMYSAQAVTPIAPGKARYFFSQGFQAPVPEEVVQGLMDVTYIAFAEDKDMIEAQQLVIDEDPDRRIMPITADKGVTLFNRLVERLIRAENADADAGPEAEMA